MISDAGRHEVSKVRKAFAISNGMSVGVVIPVDWTFNRTWKEDGKQVVCYFPRQRYTDDFNQDTLEESFDESGWIVIRAVNFTDETDCDTVRELCGMVARGEMEVRDAY